MTQVYETPADEVIIPEDRIRKEFQLDKLRELAESFSRFGQLQPGVCRKEGERVILVAGERRLKACELAGIPFSYTLSEETNPIKIREIELEENIKRVDLTFLEVVEAKEELHRLKQEQHGSGYGGHGVRETAKILGESPGLVAEDLELAAFAKVSEEVRQAKNKTEAKKIVKRLKEELNRRERLLEVTLREQEQLKEELPSDEEGKVDEDAQLLYFAKKVIHGEMEKALLNFPDNYFDIVIFDPPWGVDADKVRKKGGGTRAFEDDPSIFHKNFPNWLRLIFSKMAKDSHLYCFFGIVNHEAVYSALQSAGFEVDHIPLIWYKQGAHVTRNPDTRPGRSYEPVAYGRKGNKVLSKKGVPDVIITPAPPPSLKQSHSTAKHPDVMIDLLRRSAMPGDKILDPMAGSGMTGVACEVLNATHKLDWVLIEKEKEFRDLAIMNLVKGYHNLITEPTQPRASYELPPLPEDFRELEPGSSDWKRYWKAHPEKQGEMLEWKKEKESA